ncbi:MAG TPA: hypothetical protein VKQ32_12050 [Polyangia bacterium]|nr:hypothetical protein [Polyangia bacterium]
MRARRRILLTIGAAAVVLSTAAPAAAFSLDGHFIIEAAAYKRLLALARVPETDVSGRQLLGALIAGGLLVEPPCLDGVRAGGSCDAKARREQPLAFWPALGAGAADIIIDRQLSAGGQCQHFMAETDDGFSPPHPRFGVPTALVTTAYRRCVTILGIVFDGLLRDPALARTRLVGTYALMHAIQDSFSAAHVARDGDGRIVHLLSWTLIDWPSYLAHGTMSFPPTTHHAILEPRDTEYLRPDAVTADGQRCADIYNPYALPEECLTPRARAAADAVVDFLVVMYRLRARAAAAGRPASLAAPEDLALWHEFVAKHLPSAADVGTLALPTVTEIGSQRADTFIGAQATVGSDGWGAGGWGARFFYGPAVPFALAAVAGAGFQRGSDGNHLVAAAGLGLYLPLVRRFSIGVTPAGLAIGCNTGFHDCNATLFATVGEVLVPLPHSTWLGIQGPRWSWSERDFGGPLVGVAFGWSHEETPSPTAIAPEIVAAWDPPAPAEVSGYRVAATSWLFFVSTTAGSTSENRWVSGGIELRRDRDRWNRRAGWAPALSFAVAGGTTDGTGGGTATLAPTLRLYVVSDRLWLAAVPAAVRVGVSSTRDFYADVAGAAAAGVIVGRLELSAASPPLSYVSRDRWHALPISVRLGFLFH